MTSEAVGAGRRGVPIVGLLTLLWLCGLIAAAGPPGHCAEHSGGDTRCPGG
ncbi:hypothetical protein [Micromonospora trifolii]|uniref:hypothetical protein n=1 Tax=Micromonospora trifolii TaxID=2911208 RepID=UPI003CF7FB4A